MCINNYTYVLNSHTKAVTNLTELLIFLKRFAPLPLAILILRKVGGP